MFVRALRRQLGQTEQIPGTLCTLSDGKRGIVDLDGNCVPFEPYEPPQQPQEPQPGDGGACTQIANGQPGVLVGGRCVPPGFVAPDATELHPERWDLEECTYEVAYGDTYVGIAKTYLDPSGVRWRELWNQNRATTPDPDSLYVGQVLDLSGEACENMRRWLNRGGPNVNPSELDDEPIGDFARSWWGKVLIAAAAGGALWYMS